jgi:hypothetical protein
LTLEKSQKKSPFIVRVSPPSVEQSVVADPESVQPEIE